MLDQEIHLFLLRWRVTWPDLCFCEFVRLIESCQCGIRVLFFSLPPFQVPKCLLFFRDSLWSVNTESQIAINNLYTPSFYVVKTWCMLQMMLRYLGWYVLFMVSHFYFYFFWTPRMCFVWVFLGDLFFFRSILDGSQYLVILIHTFYV